MTDELTRRRREPSHVRLAWISRGLSYHRHGPQAVADQKQSNYPLFESLQLLSCLYVYVPPFGKMPNAPIPGQFEQDTRVSFDKVSGKWQYEDDEGTEHEWNGTAWIPIVRIMQTRTKQRLIHLSRLTMSL